VSVATTEGYAARPGGAQGKLLAEIAEDEAGRNLQIVLAEFRNYQDGIMPAGPGARELTAFFGTVDEELAGHDAGAPHIVASDQHVLNLLSKRAQVLHLAAANYCWLSKTFDNQHYGDQAVMPTCRRDTREHRACR
jgi:hypothetical protein